MSRIPVNSAQLQAALSRTPPISRDDLALELGELALRAKAGGLDAAAQCLAGLGAVCAEDDAEKMGRVLQTLADAVSNLLAGSERGPRDGQTLVDRGTE